MEGAAVVVLLVAGLGVVVFALWVVVSRDGYAEAGEDQDSVEHVHLRRVAEAGISQIAPGAMRLAERERVGGVSGFGGASAEFWRRFAAASARVEKDPGAVVGELRQLRGLLEEALRAAERPAATVGASPRREDWR